MRHHDNLDYLRSKYTITPSIKLEISFLLQYKLSKKKQKLEITYQLPSAKYGVLNLLHIYYFHVRHHDNQVFLRVSTTHPPKWLENCCKNSIVQTSNFQKCKVFVDQTVIILLNRIFQAYLTHVRLDIDALLPV